MEKKILDKIEKHGRYSESFPLRKSPVGPILTEGLFNQQVKIYLTSDGIEIYDNNAVLVKSIFYEEIDACMTINAVEHLKIDKKALLHSNYDVDVIYLHYAEDKKIYFIFWSKLKGGWMKKLHERVLNIIQDYVKVPNIKDFLIKLAPKYKDYKIPISRVVKEFPFNDIELRHIVEEIEDANFKFVQSKDYIKVNPKPNVEITGVYIDGDDEFEVVDKIEIPLQFQLKNCDSYPARIRLHLDAANLPMGKPHPPFKIDPGETMTKTINMSTYVKDDEYTIDLLLCNNDDDDLEIENSGVSFKINRKTSKRMKLKNILKSALFKSTEVLVGVAKKI